MIKTRKNGQWGMLDANMIQLAGRLRVAQHMVVQQEAHHFRAKVIKAFNTSGRSNGKSWAPNKPSTISGKSSSKPLVNRGDLRNSVVAIPAGRNRAFVGVSSRARSKDGGRVVDIAAVHEFGRIIAIKVTPAMFRYVMAQISQRGGGGGSGSGNFRPGAVLIIKIPERSFLRATAEAHFTAAKVVPRVQRRLARILALHGSENRARAYAIAKRGK